MTGLVNERLGFYLDDVGNYDRDQPYFNRSIELYRDDWGSVAKSEWLMEASAMANRGRCGRRCDPT